MPNRLNRYLRYLRYLRPAAPVFGWLAVAMWVAMLMAQDPTAVSAAPQALDRSTVEQQVIRASNEWADALSRGDLEAVDRLLADDFITIQQTTGGVVLLEKPVQMDMLRKNAANRPALRRELNRAKVRNYGNVAVLTAVATFEGTRASGDAVASQAVISEVWVNERGRWRLAHFQPTTILPRSNAGTADKQ